MTELCVIIDRIFLSTPSARRATTTVTHIVAAKEISIHALREEGDAAIQKNFGGSAKISIHALREEGDLAGRCWRSRKKKFLSTPSARRATSLHHALPNRLHISIHALREEGDLSLYHRVCRVPSISIHALREEGDPRFCRTSPPARNFYPRPPRGGRLALAVA